MCRFRNQYWMYVWGGLVYLLGGSLGAAEQKEGMEGAGGQGVQLQQPVSVYKGVCNYTTSVLKEGHKVDHVVNNLKKVQESLQDHVRVISDSVKDERETLLFVVLEDTPPYGEKVCEQYALSSKGLIEGELLRIVVHGLRYHLVQTHVSHVVLGLYQYMQACFKVTPKVVAVATYGPLCSGCGYLLRDVLGYKGRIDVNEKGCKGVPFGWPMPQAASDFVDRLILDNRHPLSVVGGIFKHVAGMVKKKEVDKLQWQLTEHKGIIQGLSDQVDKFEKEKIAWIKKSKQFEKERQAWLKDKKLLEKYEGEKKENETTINSLLDNINDLLRDQILQGIKTLRPYVKEEKVSTTDGYAKAQYGIENAGEIVKIINKDLDSITKKFTDKSTKHDLTTLKVADEKLFKAIYSSKWGLYEKIVSIKVLVTRIMVNITPNIDRTYIDLFQNNVKKHGGLVEWRVNLREEHLNHLAMALLSIKDKKVKNNLIACAEMVAKSPAFGRKFDPWHYYQIQKRRLKQNEYVLECIRFDTVSNFPILLHSGQPPF